MKKAVNQGVGVNKKEGFHIFGGKMELPEKTDTKIVVVVPLRMIIVDIEPVLIEIANLDTITAGVQRNLSALIHITGKSETSSSFLYFIWEQADRIGYLH